MASTAAGPSIPAADALSLLASFTSFLTVAVHSLLFHRGLYPPATFLTARAYNLPVHQSRHPRVCSWIRDAVAAVAAQLQLGAARRVALVVHGLPPGLEVLERWVFDVHSFPVWCRRGERLVHAPGGLDAEEELAAMVVTDEPVADGPAAVQEADGDGGGDGAINWTDINESLRGALRRIAYAAQGMETLPEGCTFTLALELREDALAPIGHPQPWIPSPSNLQPPTQARPNQGSSLGGATTKPIRSVRADPLFFECWVEQGNPDAKSNTDTPTPSQTTKGKATLTS